MDTPAPVPAAPPLSETLIACPDCDLLQRRVSLPPRGKASCARCRATLYRNHPLSPEGALALALGAAILWVMANAFPFLTFKLEGREQTTTLMGGVVELAALDHWWPAALVVFTGVLAPAVRITALLYLLLPLHLRGRLAAHSGFHYRLIGALQPWGMLEVYMLGVLVAVVKLSEMATIVLDTAFFAFAALIPVATAAGAALDPDWVRQHLESPP